MKEECRHAVETCVYFWLVSSPLQFMAEDFGFPLSGSLQSALSLMCLFTAEVSFSLPVLLILLQQAQQGQAEATQTPVTFVEVETIYEDANRRSVQTQTDPRLKKKKFGPLNVETELDLMDMEDEDGSPRRRRRREDEMALFEDTEPRRKSIKRNTEEALKCPFCDRAFIGLVKHIKSKHRDEQEYEEEMRNAKWRERIMKVSTQGTDESGETCNECGKVTKNMKRHMELHQQNRMQIPCPICGKVVLKTGMSSHMRTVHSGRKPYKCPHCDYSSAFRGNLNTHIKVRNSSGFLCMGCRQWGMMRFVDV